MNPPSPPPPPPTPTSTQVHQQSRALLIIIFIFFALFVISSLLGTDDFDDFELRDDDLSSVSTSNEQQLLTLNSFKKLKSLYLLDHNASDDLSVLKNQSSKFNEVNLYRTREHNWYFLIAKESTMFLTVVQPQAETTDLLNAHTVVQQWKLLLNETNADKNEKTVNWKLINREIFDGRAIFAQQSIVNDSCIILNYEKLEKDGLDTSVHLKTICISQETERHFSFEWKTVGSKAISSIGPSTDPRCIHVSRMNDKYHFRTLCKRDEAMNKKEFSDLEIPGPSASRYKFVDEIISMQQFHPNIIFAWELIADIDSIRNNDKITDEQNDGIDLLLKIFYKINETSNEEWKSLVYGKIKHVMQRVIQKSALRPLNQLYFYGKVPAYQSGDMKTSVFCARNGDIVIATLHNSTINDSVDDIRKLFSVKTFDFTRYLPSFAKNEDSSDFLRARRASNVPYLRMSMHGRTIYDDIERTVAEMLQSHHDRLLTSLAYSVPIKIAVNHNGTLIAVLMHTQQQVYVIQQVGQMWTVKMIIQRNTSAKKIKAGSPIEGRSFISKWLQGSNDQQTNGNNVNKLFSPTNPSLSILDIGFLGKSSDLVTVFNDFSLAVYSLGSNITKRSSTSEGTDEDLVPEQETFFESLLYFFSQNWKLCLMLFGCVSWFIMNEISLRKRIRQRRQEVLAQRAEQRERLQRQQQQRSSSPNSEHTNDSQQSPSSENNNQ
jgi:isoprenylcysteine carboxyl methyltransferase (ICMT) family protein YpbQ